MRKQVSLVVGFLLLSSFGISAAEATILNFNIDKVSDGTPPGAIVLIEPNFPNYGDNVNSLTQVDGAYLYHYDQGNGFTPNLTVGYSHGANAAAGAYYYTDGESAVSPFWKDVAFLAGSETVTERKFWFTIVPDSPEYGVKINSFDLFRWASSGANYNVDWKIYQDVVGGTLLASGTTGLFDVPISSPIVVNPSAQAYFGTVVLEIHHTLGPGGGLGFDNFNFDQVLLPVPAPEPGSMALLAVGSCLMSKRMRRSRLPKSIQAA